MSKEKDTGFSLSDRPDYTIRRQLARLNIVVGLLILLAGGIVTWQVNRLAGAVSDLQQARQRATVAFEVHQVSTQLLATINRLLPVEDAAAFETDVSVALEALLESHDKLVALKVEAREDKAVYPLLNLVDQRIDNVTGIAETMVRQAQAGQWPGVRVRVGVLVRDQQQLGSVTGKLVELTEEMEEAASRQVASVQRAAVLYPALVMVLALGLDALLAWWLTRSIVQPISVLTETVTAIAEGDLSRTVMVEARNEIGLLARAFNAMTERLRDLIDTLEDRIEERTRALETSAALSRQLTAILDFAELLRYVVNCIQTEHNFHHTHIYLIEEETGDLVIAEGSGRVGRQLKERGHRLQPGQGIVGTVASTNEYFVSNNVNRVRNYVQTPFLPDTNSELAVPLRKGERVLGVLDIQSEQMNRFALADISLMQSIANQTAVAIENARLYRQAQQEISERERVEEQLRLQAAALEAAANGIVITDREGAILWINSAIVSLTGYTAEEALGRKPRLFRSGEQDRSFYQNLWDTILSGQVWQGELTNRRKDGNLYPEEMTITPVRDAGGEITNFIAIKQDISERKRAEDRIRHLNRLKEDLLSSDSLDEKLKRITDEIVAIFEADFARIWVIKPGDRCDSGCFHARVMAGPHVCRYRDRCLHLMTSSGRYTHTAGEMHRRVPFGCYKIGRVAAGEDPNFITNDVMHDPHIHDHDWSRKLGLVSFAVCRLLSTAGEPIGVLALFSQHVISPEEDALLEGLANTTAQVIQTARAEKALRESEKRYYALFEEAPVMYLTVRDESGTPIISNCNAAFLATLGYSRDKVVEQPLVNFYTPESQAALLEGGDFQKTLKDELKTPTERYLVTRDGRTIVTLLRAVPEFSVTGQVIGTRAMFTDITERKQAEEQIRASLKEKEVLLQEIHHRVKNNLQVISSLLNLQSGYVEDPHALEIFQESQNRVRSMALIHEKLYQSPDLARIDLAEYIQSLAAYLFRSYHAAAGGVSLKIQADDVFLGIDAAVPCGLILNELVSNSLKHAFPATRPSGGEEKGGSEICIELRANGDGQVTLRVGDNGVGFPAETDFQNTTSLGLQLVNTLVNQLNGAVELDGSAGTEFKIMFAAQ